MKKPIIMLDKLMREGGVTQDELSRETGIAVNTIKAYRYNRVQRPDLDVIARFCAFFRVDLGELIRLEDEADSELLAVAAL